jgi:hypothetical protein
MNLFGKIIGGVKAFFARSALSKITEVARESVATSKALTNAPIVKIRVINQRGAFGQSREQRARNYARREGLCT